MCHVFRFGSSDTYNLVVSADGVVVCGEVRLGSREHTGKIGVGTSQNKSDTGLGIELRRGSQSGAVFRSHF